ncbi:hypothetical protein RRG08_031161 [Elysia crispata]|uniref:Uncharacterized protein n=1 Tax=Elysia crispata TaxID=231223 RepID=A0AAE1DG94_9GAST|nr:hypothetical protein RRG08_031161 [Elysia crispata]
MANPCATDDHWSFRDKCEDKLSCGGSQVSSNELTEQFPCEVSRKFSRVLRQDFLFDRRIDPCSNNNKRHRVKPQCLLVKLVSANWTTGSRL